MLENLIGRRFGHLLVLKLDETKKKAHRYWLCRCDCGTLCSVSGTHLRTGYTKSCGCYRKKTQMHGWLNLTGERYGRLTVLGPWKKDSLFLNIGKDGDV